MSAEPHPTPAQVGYSFGKEGDAFTLRFYGYDQHLEVRSGVSDCAAGGPLECPRPRLRAMGPVGDASGSVLAPQLATCDTAHPKFGGATEELQDKEGNLRNPTRPKYGEWSTQVGAQATKVAPPMETGLPNVLHRHASVSTPTTSAGRNIPFASLRPPFRPTGLLNSHERVSAQVSSNALVAQCHSQYQASPLNSG